MMTKKNYIKFAEILGNSELNFQSEELKAFMVNLVDYLKEDNPNFDRIRFLEAIKDIQDGKYVQVSE